MATLLSSIGLVVFGPASPAKADPACVNGGVYVLFARGSGEHFNDLRAHQFYWSLIGSDEYPGALHGKVTTAWAELGNLYPDFKVEGADYPAVGVPWNLFPWIYGDSVTKGTNELVAHLNDRASRCPSETIVLGGYSQGADVIGWALQRTGWGSLDQTTRDHIGYVALYGDPKFNPGGLEQRQQWQRPWWVRGDDTGFRYRGSGTLSNAGVLGARVAYVPPEFGGRFGSWCAYRDGICTGSIADDGKEFSHSTAYQNSPDIGYTGWIARSAAEIANKAIVKRNSLNPSLLPATGPSYTIPGPDPNVNPPITSPPPTPVITRVKRTTDHAGIRQVYAATNTAVTEAWWHPGQGVTTKEMIHISQGDIVGFDKVNEPDGTTQSLYTAVPDGIWETWWRPGDGPHSSKIITGLNGVRQVIADPVVESGQYTHRLYILAQDGPYEAWWREGGDGIHISRLDIVNDPVTMDKARGPDGTEQLYVATPTYVYELWWRPGESVHHGEIIHISQGDIRSLDKGDNLSSGGQLLYTGTSTTAWQSYWNGGPISHGTIAQSQTNAIQIKKTVYNGVHELYLATGDHVQEYWWTDTASGTSTLIDIAQNNITAFDKSNDGADQQVYTASGDLVYETWWRGGSNPSGPNTSVLFKVAR